jgi:kynurenine formamidase
MHTARCVPIAVVIAASFVAALCSSPFLPTKADDGSAQPQAASLTLEKLCSGGLPIVDLTHPLNDKSPFWPGENYEPFRLKTIATLEQNGVLSKAFSCPEHFGTHLDAPNHFEKNQPSADQLDPVNFFAPGVVIDVATQAGADADHVLTLAELAEWEQVNGKVPEGAIVLLRTGWHRFWGNPARYRNQDVMGKMHFPGYSAEAARALIHDRKAKGLAIDTLSIDPGTSRDFPVHHIVNAAGRYALENVANFDALPPRAFYVFAAPIKIETGTGGPTRVFAILPPGRAK